MAFGAVSEDLLPPGFPNIDMGPQLKVVERTRTATMLCAASGNPDPEITWYKDFLPIDPSASNGRIKQLRSESFGKCLCRNAVWLNSPIPHLGWVDPLAHSQVRMGDSDRCSPID
ncbi:Receptor-type tyrosine-protein phosphatase S, partial [Dissostichus eleginoides]